MCSCSEEACGEGKAILNLVSMAAGDCAGDEKPQRSTPETENERKQQTERVAACLEV